MNWKRVCSSYWFEYPAFVNGHYRPSSSADFFDNINPATEATLCRSPVGNAADIDETVHIARLRFNNGCWSELPPVRRVEIFLKVTDLIVQHKSEVALLDTLEMGKPIQAAIYDAEKFCPLLPRSWTGFADKLLGASAPLVCDARSPSNRPSE